MGLFGLDWFKSEKAKELEKLEIEKRKLSVELLKVKIGKEQEIFAPKNYKSLKLIGNVLTVVLTDGEIISKTEATADDFRRVKNSVTLDDILTIIGSNTTMVERIKEKENVVNIEKAGRGLTVLKDFKDFEIKDKVVFFKTSKRSIPPLLVAKFVGIVDKYSKNRTTAAIEKLLETDTEYQGLKNFFMWACLNPRAEVAADLYDFLERNSFRITKQGFFVALRNVVTVASNKDTEIVQFISNAYNKIKAVWKKNPDNYVITNANGEYKLEKETLTEIYSGTVIGKLTDLYLNLPNMKENRFTDDWTKTFDIRVGQVTNMPMAECEWNRADCASAGLHFTSDQIHYVGCGDTSVLILINPMKVVGIGTHKGRCYEYLPIMTVPRDEATTILHDIDFDTLELDEDYAIKELEKLAEVAKLGFIAETTKNQFNLPAISNIEMNNIIQSLKGMKKILKKRVSIIK
jgi:hypothetical protein